MKTYYTYIATNIVNTVLYVGVTNNLDKRMFEHSNKMKDGFTKKYNIDKLVYYEETPDVKSALEREKQLKRWHREWKVNLVKEKNPDFRDLLNELGS